METKNCIICGGIVKVSTGHIHTEIGCIGTGWCEKHYNEGCNFIRPRSKKCTSINPNSCGGDYNLSEIELKQELNAKNLADHLESELFSKEVDSYFIKPYHIQQQKEFNAQQTLNWLLAITVMIILACISIGAVYLLSIVLK